jgi:hypothetical protein
VELVEAVSLCSGPLLTRGREGDVVFTWNLETQGPPPGNSCRGGILSQEMLLLKAMCFAIRTCNRPSTLVVALLVSE